MVIATSLSASKVQQTLVALGSVALLLLAAEAVLFAVHMRAPVRPKVAVQLGYARVIVGLVLAGAIASAVVVAGVAWPGRLRQRSS